MSKFTFSCLLPLPVLRIRDVYPGSRIRPFLFRIRIFFHPRFRILIKEFKYFNPKKWFLSSGKYDPGCSSRIRIMTFYPSRIPDPGSRGQKGTGSGSAKLVFTRASRWQGGNPDGKTRRGANPTKTASTLTYRTDMHLKHLVLRLT